MNVGQQFDLFNDGRMVKPTGVLKHHIPNVITKELGISRLGEKRKIRLSTNWLPLVGFEAGVRHSVEAIGGMNGLLLKCDTDGSQKVYERSYKRAGNNPLETVIEIGGQSLLNAGIPSYTERLHFTLMKGEIVIRPLPNHTFSIRKAMKEAANPFTALVAMTSGVDVRCLMDTGFQIECCIEYRPNEKRDKDRDLSETGALNVLANSSPKILINEDISKIDWNYTKTLFASSPQVAVAHFSLCCDDFSNLKANSLKEKSLDDLSTSHDLVYDALRCIETINPAVIVVEQVKGFGTSSEVQLLKTKLRKWGYYITDDVLNAAEFGGLTRRERYYLVASIYPDFQMCKPGLFRTESIWPEIEPFLNQCRDVSHTKTLHDGISTGRARLIKQSSCVSPTIVKSQNRQVKDSVYIEMPDGRYLFPSIELLTHLQGIPCDFNLDSVSQEQAVEIIGQSICFKLHHEVMKAVYDHIGDNVGHHTAVVLKRH